MDTRQKERKHLLRVLRLQAIILSRVLRLSVSLSGYSSRLPSLNTSVLPPWHLGVDATMEPIDLTASSDDEPGSGHTQSRKPNGFHTRNAGSKTTDMVDLTTDEPDYDPYLMSGTLSSPMPRTLQNLYTAPASIPREQESSVAHPNGAPLQTHADRGLHTADASNVNFRANGPTWTPVPMGPFRHSVAPGTSTETDSNTPSRADVLGQGSGVRMLIDLAAPIAHVHLGPSTPVHNKATVTRRSESVIPMHPHHQSPGPAQFTAKSKSADRIQPHAPNAAQIDKEKPPLQNIDASSGVRRNFRSSSFSFRKATGDHASDLNTRLSDPGQPPELPLTIEFFQECLQKAIRDLRNDHQYYVKVTKVPFWHVLLADQRISHFYLVRDTINPSLVLLPTSLLQTYAMESRHLRSLGASGRQPLRLRTSSH